MGEEEGAEARGDQTSASVSGSRLQLLRTENDRGGQRGVVVWLPVTSLCAVIWKCYSQFRTENPGFPPALFWEAWVSFCV